MIDAGQRAKTPSRLEWHRLRHLAKSNLPALACHAAETPATECRGAPGALGQDTSSLAALRLVVDGFEVVEAEVATIWKGIWRQITPVDPLDAFWQFSIRVHEFGQGCPCLAESDIEPDWTKILVQCAHPL